MRTAAVGAIVLAALARTAIAQQADPRVLYAEGSYVAAATIFEDRYRAEGRPNDGVSAVVAWRAAGRYAHARVLLARVKPKVEAGGKLAERVQLLDDKLARLTASAILDGTLQKGSIIQVDGQLPEQLGGQILFDAGARTLTIEHELCDPFHWRGVALPGDTLHIPVALRCDQQGTLHVSTYAYGTWERKRTVTIDGKPYPTGGKDNREHRQELDVQLSPGPHHIHIEHRDRLVADERVMIAPHATVSRDYRYPWRATIGGALGVRATGVASGNRLAPLAGAGLGVVLEGSWLLISMDFGGAAIGTSSEGRGFWFGAEGEYHLLHRPLWQTHRKGLVVTLDFDPLAIRYDAQSRPATERAGTTRSTGYLSLLPIRAAAEWTHWQLGLTIWPVTWIYTEVNLIPAPVPAQSAWGASTLLTLTWHQ